MRAQLRVFQENPGLRDLWLAGMTSQVGDWLSLVAVSLMALHVGEGALSVALVLLFHTLPAALLAPVSGALADRFDRRKMLIACALGSASLTAAMAIAAAAGALFPVLALLLVRTAVESVGDNARSAAIQQLTPRRDLVTAHTALAASWSVMFTLGMAAGGALAELGIALAIGLDALTFLVAVAILLRLPRLHPERASDSEGVSIRHAMAVAWRHSASVAGLRRAVLAKGPLALAGGAGWILLNLTAGARLGLATGAAIGVLHGVRGIGTGLGPQAAAWWLARGGRTPIVWWAQNALCLAGVALFISSTDAATSLAAMFGWGAGMGGNWVLSTAMVQELAPRSAVGRISALDKLISVVAMGAGALGVAAASDWGLDPGRAATAAVVLAAVGWLAIAPGRDAEPHPAYSSTAL